MSPVSNWCRRLALVVAIPLPAVADLANPGFELGPFGSGDPFAGGFARSLSDAVPTGWALAALGTGNEDRWVNSAAAHSGTRYVYMSSELPWPSDDCLQGKNFDCWDKGFTFRYSAWVASADAGAASNRFNFEFREYLQSGAILDSVYSFDLAPNSSWSDDALTALPWQQVSQTHTFQADTLRVDFWVTAQQDSAGGLSSVAIDDVACVLVPAPHAAALLGFAAAMSSLSRRRMR